MKRRNIMRICISVLLFAAMTYIYFPMKIAVPKILINTDSEYIIVRQVRMTDIQWKIVPDEHCKYKDQNYARLSGDFPRGFNANVEMSENQFICYGQLVEYEPGGVIEFNVTHWEIEYPIRYDWAVFPFLHPSAYLCKLDYDPET